MRGEANMLSKTNNPRPTAAKPCLLYVDDDQSNIVVMEMRLESHYEVLTASSDREACSLLRKHGQRLSVVLMDIQLIGSQLDGIALTRLLRGTLDEASTPVHARNVPVRADLPVLFVTAFGEQHNMDALFAAGGSAIIAKPVDFVKLSRAMTRHHLKSLLGDETGG
jgi:two-component system sensor histidine kinase BarA